MYFFLSTQYKDDRLKFYKSDAGVDRFLLPCSETSDSWLWDPLITVSWSLSNTHIVPPMSSLSSNEITYKDGLNVRYYSNEAVQLSQEFDVKWYPFDRQTFILKMGSERHLGEVSTTFSSRFRGRPLWTDPYVASGDLKCRGNSSTCSLVRTIPSSSSLSLSVFWFALNY